MSNSLSLSVQNKKSLTENEKTVTTKELAQVLGVSNMAITRVLDKTNNLNGTVKVENGKTTVFTEKQATIIKQEIQKHHNLATRQIDGVTTEYEENQTIANAIMILQKRSAEYKARMEIAENALDRIANGKGCFSMGQTAKKLNIVVDGKKLGRNNFIEFLKDKKILMENGEPYQSQIQTEHFKTIVSFINDKVGNKSVTLTTGKGIVYLAKKFNATIDESVLSDYN